MSSFYDPTTSPNCLISKKACHHRRWPMHRILVGVKATRSIHRNPMKMVRMQCTCNVRWHCYRHPHADSLRLYSNNNIQTWLTQPYPSYPTPEKWFQIYLQPQTPAPFGVQDRAKRDRKMQESWHNFAWCTNDRTIGVLLLNVVHVKRCLGF